MKVKYGLENLRRLKDIPAIEIRPITILVGRNSSGKSTFLRSLALLRQSITTRTSSPILWYGDLVDFGSYSISTSEDDQPISFRFSIDNLAQVDYRQRVRYSHNPRRYNNYDDIQYTITIVPKGNQTRIQQISITVNSLDAHYIIKVGDDNAISSVVLNGRDVKSLLSDISLSISFGSIFPEMSASRKKEDRVLVVHPRNLYYPAYNSDSILEILVSFLKKNLAKNLSLEKLHELSYSILSRFHSEGKRTLLHTSLKGAKTVTSWRKFIEKTSKEENLHRDFVNAVYLSILPEIVNPTSFAARSIVTKLLYIGPARARSDRYYRYQDLSVSEIDPDGKNFPMFLNSLSPHQVDTLSTWIEKLFGYGLVVSRPEGGGHLSIDLVEDNAKFNIVDTGYGVSQILPVLAQVWWARERSVTQTTNSSAPTILAIEQPELHLHPAHQALLADAFVGEATAEQNQQREHRVHFLIETHSETLINRLGELISLKRLRPDDINIILFEPDKDDKRISRTSVATFSEDGSLMNWPFGFFQPTVN